MNETVDGVVQEYSYSRGPDARSVVNAYQNLLQGELNFNGRHLATYENGGTMFTSGDGQGNERVRTETTGAVTMSCTNLPFGDAEVCSGADPDPLHFTGQPRDPETSLDDFGARYNSSQLGRFMTADWSESPEAVPYSNLENPQSLNLYSYVLNNPAGDIDSDGHYMDNGGDDGPNCGSPCVVTGSIDAVSLDQAQAMANFANRAIMLGRQRSNELVRLLEQHWKFVAAQVAIAALAAATDGAAAPLEGAVEGGEVAGTAADGAAGTVEATESGLQHVVDRHFLGGAASEGKSLFNAGEDAAGLVRAANAVPAQAGANGNLIRVVDAGRVIGIDRATGLPTSTYTVVTNSAGKLVTAFPGRP